MTFRIAPSTLECAACSTLPPDARCPERCARNFVVGCWSASFKHSRDAGMITSDDWVEVMHVQIAKITARPECRVLLAHGHADPSVYLGFIAGEPDEKIVYYCFVKELYRRKGIARAMFHALGIEPASRFAYPCQTRVTYDLRSKMPLAIRDPAVARYPKGQRDRRYA